MHSRDVRQLRRRHERIAAGKVQLSSRCGDNTVPLQHDHRVRVGMRVDLSVIAEPAVPHQAGAQAARRRRAHAPFHPARIGAAETSLVFDVELADQFGDHFHVLGDQLSALDRDRPGSRFRARHQAPSPPLYRSAAAMRIRYPRARGAARPATVLLAGRGMRSKGAAGTVGTMKPTQLLHEAGQSLWLDNITRALLDLRRAAGLFAPVHARTDGVDGWVSLEVSPLLAHDTPRTVDQAESLHREAALGNLFIKIPGTAEGLPAIEECIYAGVPVNVTLLFSAEQYRAAAEAYLRGVQRRIRAELNPAVGSVASLFVSRWDAAVADRVPDELRNRLGIAVAKQAYRE